MTHWSLPDLLPGLGIALLAAALGLALRRWFDPIPHRCWIAWAIALGILFGPALFGGRVLLSVGYLTQIAPFRLLWQEPGPPPGNLLQSDTMLQITPWLNQVRQAYAAGEWPLWNALAGAGEPLLGNPQTQAWQPLVWPSLIFPRAHGLVVTASLRVLVALVFFYLLLRRQGISEPPALAASLAFGLGGGLLLWLNWPMANSAALLPALFYGIVVVDERGAIQDRVLLALAVMALLCAGHPETIVHGAALATVFALARLSRQSVLRWVVCVAVGGALAAPALLPAAGYLPQSLRASMLAARQQRIAAGEPAATETAAPGSRLVPLLAPNAYGNSRFGAYWGESNSNEDAAGFPGTAAVLAAMLVLAPVGRRFPQERLMIGASAVVLLVLAQPPGLDRVLNAIPVLRSSLTSHHRLLLVLGFCLAYLAACTWERWSELPRRRVLAAAAIAAVLVVWAYGAHPGPGLTGLRLASLAVQLGVLLLAVMLRKPWGLAAVVAAELLFFHQPANPSVSARFFYPETPPIRFVRERLDPWQRMAGLGPALRANLPSMYGLADPRSSNPAKPVAYLEATSRINMTPERATDGFGATADPLYQLLGVRYLMTPVDSAVPGPWALVLRDASGWVWERERALPRVFLPHAALPCPAGDAWSQCTEPIENFNREAAVRPARSWAAAAPRASGLVLLDLRSTWLRARAGLAEPRLLASSIYQDGGWNVLRDGARQAPVEANGPFAAAWLPAGEARIDLLYRPPGFLAGMLLAAAALAAVAALWMAPPGQPSARPSAREFSSLLRALAARRAAKLARARSATT